MMAELQDLETELRFKALSVSLAKRVKAYFQDPVHRKEFEDWYKQKHGTNYEWKDGVIA